MPKRTYAPHLYAEAIDKCHHSPDSICIAFLQRQLKLDYCVAINLMEDLISNNEIVCLLHNGEKIYKLGSPKSQPKFTAKLKKIFVAIFATCTAWFARGDTTNLNFVRWYEPAVLRGKVYKGIYTDCCTFGAETTKTYYSLKLKNPIQVTGVLAESNMQIETDEIQLSYSKDVTKHLRIGQTVNIACSNVLFGSTGHYAKQVFCEKATFLPNE